MKKSLATRFLMITVVAASFLALLAPHHVQAGAPVWAPLNSRTYAGAEVRADSDGTHSGEEGFRVIVGGGTGTTEVLKVTQVDSFLGGRGDTIIRADTDGSDSANQGVFIHSSGRRVAEFFGNRIHLQENTSVTRTFGVSGATTLSGGATITGGASIAGGLNNNNGNIINAGEVSGVTNLGVTGETTIGGATTIGGPTTINNTLTVTRATTLNGNLGVTGLTTTAGINNNIGGINNLGGIVTDTLSATVSATLGSANVTGALSVGGATTTNGITNTGNIGTNTLSTTALATLNSASVTNALSVGGATTINNTLDVTGATTINNTLTVTGNSTLGGAVNNIGADPAFASANTIGNTNPGSTVTAVGGNSNMSLVNNAGGIRVTGAPAVGSGGVSVVLTGATRSVANPQAVADINGRITNATTGTATESTTALTLTNDLGNTQGIVVHQNRTVVSGGQQSTSLILDDAGATFSDSANGAPVRVGGVADAVSDHDAVNFAQFNRGLERAFSGIASVAALAAIPSPAPGNRFSLGLGYGYYQDSNAVAIGGRAAITRNISATVGVGFSRERTTVNAGVGFSW